MFGEGKRCALSLTMGARRWNCSCTTGTTRRRPLYHVAAVAACRKMRDRGCVHVGCVHVTLNNVGEHVSDVTLFRRMRRRLTCCSSWRCSRAKKAALKKSRARARDVQCAAG